MIIQIRSTYDAMYNSMLWFFLLGALLPVVVFLLSKKFPQSRVLKKVGYLFPCPN